MGLQSFTNATWDLILSSSSLPVMVAFTAKWCPHCQSLLPVLRKFAEDKDKKAVVGTVDTDQERTLSHRYRVSGIPALFVFKGGQEMAHATGEQTPQELEELLSRAQVTDYTLLDPITLAKA